jgi:hypothetical protein
MKRGRAALVVAALNLTVPAVARAFPDALGPRPTAMGDAGRADARATDALRLNPADMSIASLYTVAGDYQLMTKEGGQALNVAVADSTSEFKLGGGLYYAHRGASAAGLPSLAAHEAGLALSFPLADRVFIGGTVKYFRVSNGAEPDGTTDHNGFTADVGLAFKTGTGVTLGVVGYNLRDLSTTQAPVALGYGIALTPGDNLTAVVDVLHDFTTSDPTRGVRTSVGGGAELLLKDRVALRAGGGHDGGARGPSAGYLSAGIAAISELGALDASVRQDVTGDHKITTVVLGLRIFVQTPQAPQGLGSPSSGSSSSGGGPAPGFAPADSSSGSPSRPSSSPSSSPSSGPSADIH